MASDQIVTMETIRNAYFDSSPNSWICEIDADYLQSQVSYYGLNQYVSYYSHASQIIRGKKFDLSEVSQTKLNKLVASCKLLYGLLHGRFILTEEGVYQMNIKYNKGLFGHCPRFACDQQKLLPIGLTTVPGQEKVKCYCPRCHDIYETNADYDAAFFGPDFPFMFKKINNMPIHMNFVPINVNAIAEKDEKGSADPPIEKRLVRWGETLPSK